MHQHDGTGFLRHLLWQQIVFLNNKVLMMVSQCGEKSGCFMEAYPRGYLLAMNSMPLYRFFQWHDSPAKIAQ